MRCGFLLFALFLPLALLGQSRAEQKAPPKQESKEAKPDPTIGSANTQPASATKQDQPQQQTYKCPLPVWTDPFWSNWGLVLVGVVTAWIALGTLSDLKEQTAATKTLAGAAKKSAEVAEMSLKHAERADILLNRCSLNCGANWSEAQCRVVLEFKNFGRTRADGVKLSLDLVIEGVPKTDCEAVPFITMGAGETKIISSQQFGDFLDAPTAAAVFTRQIPVRFNGGVTYKDIFGNEHSFSCAGTYDWNTRLFHIDGQSAD